MGAASLRTGQSGASRGPVRTGQRVTAGVPGPGPTPTPPAPTPPALDPIPCHRRRRPTPRHRRRRPTPRRCRPAPDRRSDARRIPPDRPPSRLAVMCPGSSIGGVARRATRGTGGCDIAGVVGSYVHTRHSRRGECGSGHAYGSLRGSRRLRPLDCGVMTRPTRCTTVALTLAASYAAAHAPAIQRHRAGEPVLPAPGRVESCPPRASAQSWPAPTSSIRLPHGSAV
jgi:hypothetical protein